MQDLDIGELSDAVFVGVNWDPERGWLAAFVSRYGDAFGLDAAELALRIRFLRQQGRNVAEEKRAERELEKQRFHP